MTEYRTKNLYLTAADAGELFDLDLSEACKEIIMQVDLICYDQDPDEIQHGWEIDDRYGKPELWIHDADGHCVSDENAIALRLGRAMIEAIKAKMLEDY